jgi:hypothetical protein
VKLFPLLELLKSDVPDAGRGYYLAVVRVVTQESGVSLAREVLLREALRKWKMLRMWCRQSIFESSQGWCWTGGRVGRWMWLRGEGRACWS